MILPCFLPQTFFIPFDFYNHICSFLSRYPYNSPLAILEFWFTCGVKMMSLHHGWGWQPPQTDSCVHIRHILKSVWAHWNAVHWHMAVASNTYTHTTWLIFWGLGHLWSQIDVITSWLRMADNSNCFLHSHLYIQSVWAHWHAVHGHMAVASNIYTHTTWLIFWGSGSLMELKWCHYVMVEAEDPHHTASCIYIGHI